MLNINSFTKSFNGKKVLDNVSLDVPTGSIAVLLGSSGVGKSTLLRVLNNLEKLDAGTVQLNGVPLDLSAVNKTHQVGMVFQQFYLFDHLTVEQNITLPLEKVLKKTTKEAHAVAVQLLEQYGLGDKAALAVSQLSGGQKQRLALVRTIALQPKVICMDEPTSALDPLLTAMVAQEIRELAQRGYTILIATHDISLLERLNGQVYLMRDGRIVEAAPVEQLFATPEQFPALKKFVAGEHNES